MPEATLDAEGGTLKQNRYGPGHHGGHMPLTGLTPKDSFHLGFEFLTHPLLAV